jgi:mannose-6-phosphate isomerase-like protein (cupin superfamily)
VNVRDVSGTALGDVNVAISGPAGFRKLTTDPTGGADLMLADGSYRLRFEKEGFVTLERDVMIKNGQPAQVDVVMNLAPKPIVAPAPPPPPTPPPVPAATQVPAGPPTNVSIPTFLDKNFIGRDPLKESVLGCTPDTTTRLLQLRDALAAHTHADLDEILYVVAGEGAIHIGEDVTPISPGSLSIVPRGVQHAFERRGKNPLILLSTLAGTPCRSAGQTAQESRR